MGSNNDIEVVIGGKVITLSGSESEEYLQKVSSYINNKIAEYNNVDSFRRQPADMQNVLLLLNIADDYFKIKKEVDALQDEIDAKDRELYDLKHELIASQIKLESREKQIKSIQGK
ncbi:MAG: cell division protein ZapA [Lachnospiraceae bacterium]|nr:cell division protein ZapA [Lachnospiraceae bacterium]